MSDLHSEANLHGDAVVPLWRLSMDQKEFSAWTGNLRSGDGNIQGDEFSRFSAADVPSAATTSDQQDADIFDVAYKKGWEDGQAALTMEQTDNTEAADKLSTAIGKLNDLYSAGSFEFILASVESLFRRCAELAVPDEKLLQAWAAQLADMIDQNQKGASLVLHPDDLPMIDKDTCKLPLRGDESMLRGNLKLSHSGGWIEKGSEVALDELRALIEEFHDEQTEAGGEWSTHARP